MLLSAMLMMRAPRLPKNLISDEPAVLLPTRATEKCPCSQKALSHDLSAQPDVQLVPFSVCSPIPPCCGMGGTLLRHGAILCILGCPRRVAGRAAAWLCLMVICSKSKMLTTMLPLPLPLPSPAVPPHSGPASALHRGCNLKETEA